MKKQNKINIAYLRVSTEEQNLHFGLDIQRNKITQYCELYNIKNVRYISDQESGTVMNRKGLKEMIALIKAGKVDNVIVFKSDRLSRSLKNLLIMIEDIFLPSGTCFISISEQFDTGTPNGKSFLQMLGTFAEMERNNIIYRTVNGKIEKAKKGGNASGSTPLGYKAKDKKLVIDKTESETIRKIFLLRSQGNSLMNICKALNSENIETKRGGQWYKGTIRYILNNKKYYGTSNYNFNVSSFKINENISVLNKKIAIL
jgi:site-specific DNA recombinase